MAGEPIQTDRSIRWPSTAGIQDQDARRAVDALILIVRNITESVYNDLQLLNEANMLFEALYPEGTGANGSVTLTNASTAYAVPASAPAKNYVLVLYNGSDTDMLWGYANSASNGILLPAGGIASLCLGVSQSVYAYCGSAGKIVSYSYKAVD